jgi:hypothetical protein
MIKLNKILMHISTKIHTFSAYTMNTGEPAPNINQVATHTSSTLSIRWTRTSTPTLDQVHARPLPVRCRDQVHARPPWITSTPWILYDGENRMLRRQRIVRRKKRILSRGVLRGLPARASLGRWTPTSDPLSLGPNILIIKLNVYID